MQFDLSPLRVKRLLHDPAFYVALAVIIGNAVPQLADWYKTHEDAFVYLKIVLAGHFLVRGGAALSQGKAMAAAIPEVAQTERFHGLTQDAPPPSAPFDQEVHGGE